MIDAAPVTAIGTVPLPLALAAAAVAVLALPGRAPLRRTRVTSSVAPRRSAVPRQALFPAVGAAAAVQLFGAPWWCLLAAAALAGYVAVRVGRREKPLPIGEMRAVAATLDIFAACLDSGLATSSALAAGIGQEPPPGGAHDALAQTAALLALGGDPSQAWLPVARIPALAGLATAAQRSASGGLRLADAAREFATGLRTVCRTTVTDRAARAGVAMTAPLALCFLPAFMCLGLAPTVIGMVTSLNLW